MPENGCYVTYDQLQGNKKALVGSHPEVPDRLKKGIGLLWVGTNDEVKSMPAETKRKRLAVLRLHDFTGPYAQKVLDGLVEHVDQVLFVVSPLTHPSLLEMASGCKKAVDIFHDAEPWANGPSLDRAFRVVDKLAPDVVLYTDHDDLLHERFEEDFERWYWQSKHQPVAQFQYLFCWDDENHVAFGEIKCDYHAKMLRWKKGIRFVPYAGYCRPTSYGPIFTATWPIRHLCFVTQEMREQRLGCKHRRRKDREWIETGAYPVETYNPDEPWVEWKRRVVNKQLREDSKC